METEPKEAEPVGIDSERGDTDAANTSTQDSSITNGDGADDKQEMVELKIIWNKNKYDLKIPVDETGAKLKESIHSLTGKGGAGAFLVGRLRRFKRSPSSLQVFLQPCRK